VKSICNLPSVQGTENHMHFGLMKPACEIHVTTANLLTGSGFHEEEK